MQVLFLAEKWMSHSRVEVIADMAHRLSRPVLAKTISPIGMVLDAKLVGGRLVEPNGL